MAEADERNIRTLSLGRTTPQPNTLVIFGAAGDLTRRKLLPAVWNLKLDGLLPENFAVVGFTRRDWDDQTFREGAREAVAKYSRRKVDAGKWPEFEKGLFHSKGAFDDPAAYAELKRKLDEIDRERGIPGNRVYYLSIPPSTIATCVEELQRAGLVESLEPDRPFTRIIVEKPIGHDLESARRINDDVARVFDERQVFRIDHYLGKETVQSILVLRFANSIFEPLWNQKYIDHVQITVSEEEGVGTRAGYYEEAGALRDMVQNHILQLLALIAMEPPARFDGTSIRDEKVKVLRSLRPIEPKDAGHLTVTGQYGAGAVGEKVVKSYADELGKSSNTETFVAIKAHVDNWRWQGVPFYLRTGKRLPARQSEIAIQFKPVPHSIFADRGGQLQPNTLVIRLQPEEYVRLLVMAKQPGLDRDGIRLREVPLNLSLDTEFAGTRRRIAYERLLLDLIEGDPTLFVRRDEVEAQWRWIDGIRAGWEANDLKPKPYPSGSWGPSAGIALTERDGVTWTE